ncbi:MAG: D-alanyl-D-alanine carboxypeptidase [Clostridiaceae bacterium]|nr:D-alanyl-D-alanine carboxypeptidase [Clostridiaceae bacterium]
MKILKFYVFSKDKITFKASEGFFSMKSLKISILAIYIFSFLTIINSCLVYADSTESSDSYIGTNVLNNIADNLGIEAEGFVLIDSHTGIILFSDNADKKQIYPASTTKIMTAIVALENKSLDTVMTASQAAVYDIGEGGMNIGIMAGEEITFSDLLHAMLICSANEAANIIAENVASSRDEFISMMNERARELGAMDTHFVNTNGMHHKEHYTTAKDMAIIARHAMSIPAFREIVKKESFIMTPTNKHEAWEPLYTTNKFLRYGTSPGCNFDIIGIKTGFTTPAGHNLITAAVDESGMELISVVLGVKTPRSWEDVYDYTEKLLQFGFNNFSLKKLIAENAYVTTVAVENSNDSLTLDLVTDQSIFGILPLAQADAINSLNNIRQTNSKAVYSASNNNSWNIIKKVHLKPVISAPISQGEILGYIEFFRDDTVLGTANIIAANSIEKEIPSHDNFKSTKLFKVIRTIVIVVLSFLMLRFTLKRISRKANSKRNRSRAIQRYSKRLY